MDEKKMLKPRKTSMRTRIMLSVMAILLIAQAVNFFFNTRSLEASVVELACKSTYDLGSVVALQLEDYNFKTMDSENEDYESALAVLRKNIAGTEFAYLYVLTTDKSGVYYLVDSDDSEEQADIGEEFVYGYDYLKTAFEGSIFTEGVIDEDNFITSYIPIRDAKGNVQAILGCDYDAESIAQTIFKMKIYTIICGSVILFTGAIAAFIIANKTVKRQNMVNSKLYEIVNNGGDLTQLLEIKTGDEVEVTANLVNELMKYFRTVMAQIDDNSKQLNVISNHVVQEVEDTQLNLYNISAAMEQMSATVEETSSSLNQVAEHISQIDENIKVFESNSAKIGDNTDGIQTKARELYEEALREQTNASRTAEELSNTLKQSLEKSREVENINNLTKAILDIADQTNLLALNASIEAARAGEHGKGFSVVATEIGALAKESGKAAEEIQTVARKVIAAVQELSHGSEQMMTYLNDVTIKGYEKLASVCNDYRSDSTEISSEMKNFIKTTRELTDTIAGINDSVSVINIAMEENAKGVSGVAGSVSEISMNVEKVMDRSKDCNNVSVSLNNEVGKFKL